MRDSVALRAFHGKLGQAMKIYAKPNKRKSRAEIAAARDASVSRPGLSAPVREDYHAMLGGVLMHDSREMRDAYPKTDTNANRKHGGSSMYYRMREGLGQ